MENVIHSVQIVRSDRRVKTISAQVKDGVLTVSVPSRFSDAEAQRWADRMRRRLSLRIEKASLNESNGLERRAQRLNQQYFGGALQYASISYVSNQNSRWGSCSPGSRRIRLSHRLANMPAFVLDYVIVHELAHLVEPNHSRRFWKLVNRYPHAERAIGFLMGVGLVPAQQRAIEEPSLFVSPMLEEQSLFASA